MAETEINSDILKPNISFSKLFREQQEKPPTRVERQPQQQQQEEEGTKELLKPRLDTKKITQMRPFPQKVQKSGVIFVNPQTPNIEQKPQIEVDHETPNRVPYKQSLEQPNPVKQKTFDKKPDKLTEIVQNIKNILGIGRLL